MLDANINIGPTALTAIVTLPNAATNRDTARSQQLHPPCDAEPRPEVAPVAIRADQHHRRFQFGALWRNQSSRIASGSIHDAANRQGNRGVLPGRSVECLSQLYQRPCEVSNSSWRDRRDSRASPARAPMAAIAQQR